LVLTINQDSSSAVLEFANLGDEAAIHPMMGLLFGSATTPGPEFSAQSAPLHLRDQTAAWGRLVVKEAVKIDSSSFLVPGEDGKIDIGKGFVAKLGAVNHSNECHVSDIERKVAADFADLFEVKEALFKKGECYRHMRAKRLALGHSVPAARFAS